MFNSTVSFGKNNLSTNRDVYRCLICDNISHCAVSFSVIYCVWTCRQLKDHIQLFGIWFFFYVWTRLQLISCNILAKWSLEKLHLALFDDIFKRLCLIITIRLISQLNLPDWQITFEKADSIMIVNGVQIMNNHHKAVKALKDMDLVGGNWP